MDVEKYEILCRHIDQADITDDEREFLKRAATRHYGFRYDKIADYYISATDEMKRLLEESACVIIDFDNALANGYVRLSKRIESIINQRKQDAEIEK